MKTLFTRFPLESIHNGGAERQVMSLAQGLAERGHAVAFVGSCPVLLDEFERCDLICAEMDTLTPPVTKFAAISFAWRKKSMKRKLVSMLDSFGKLDAIVMLSMTEKLLLTDVAAERGIRVFWIEHDPVGRWLTKNPWLKLLKKQSAFATTVTVSELSRVQYLEMNWTPKKTVAIPNGIDDAWFSEQPGTKKRAEDDLHLGYVGRLADEKGVDLLVRAVADIDHVTLDIVGDGPEEVALKKQVHRLGLEHRVRFFGRTNDVAHVYKTIDALVLPSCSIDPFGMVVAEAMAMGVPCLVTDACGIATCLEAARDVLVVRRDDIRALVKGIKELQKAEIRQSLSVNGAKAARQQFAVSTMVDRYEHLFTGKTR